MYTANLSSKGQLVIPKHLRKRYGWKPGQRFELVTYEDGIYIRPYKPFAPTELDEVAGRLHYDGPAIPVEHLKGGLALVKKHGRR